MFLTDRISITLTGLLHQHAFSVIRSAGSSTYNFVDPPRRDVVNIGSSVNDNVTVRFTTDNVSYASSV